MPLDNATVLITGANRGIAEFGGLLAADAEIRLRHEVLADGWTRQVKLGLSAQPGVYLQARD